jgi:hypothetical protein
MDTNARIAVFIISFTLLLFILRLVKNRRIWERYAILWVALGFSVLAFAFLVDFVDRILLDLHIEHPPSFYLLVAIVCVLLIILQCTVEITTLVRQNRDAVQAIAILEERVHEMERRLTREGQETGRP